MPGRLERYFIEDGSICVIDYAHTPDALESPFAIRPLCGGKLWLVFGHGGDRFRKIDHCLVAWRPVWQIILSLPWIIPEAKIRGNRASDSGGHKIKFSDPDYKIIIDRKKLYFALDHARANDVVLITGKGPERQIIFKDHVVAYSDFDALKEWCDSRGKKFL